MTQKIITYYIPQNINIAKGKIYNLYLNKVTNLDLSQIIPNQNTNFNGLLQPNKSVSSRQVSVSQEDYNSIISLAENTEKLYNQSQNIIKKLTKGAIKNE